MLRDPYKRNWIICIGGYMQDRSLATTGMCGLAKQLDTMYCPEVYVDYEPWKQDWKSTAEWIYRWSGYDQASPNGVVDPPKIMVVAYSWGAGWGLRQLAKHLSYRDLHIRTAVVSDAVRHVGWTWSHSVGIPFPGGVLGLSQMCAYWPYWTIEKPSNIQEFHWFRQGRNRSIVEDLRNGCTLLYGHKWVEKTQTILGPIITECSNGVMIDGPNHTNMDDTPLFREKVFSIAKELFGSRKPA